MLNKNSSFFGESRASNINFYLQLMRQQLFKYQFLIISFEFLI